MGINAMTPMSTCSKLAKDKKVAHSITICITYIVKLLSL